MFFFLPKRGLGQKNQFIAIIVINIIIIIINKQGFQAPSAKGINIISLNIIISSKRLNQGRAF